MKIPLTIEKTIVTKTIERTEKERIWRNATAILALITLILAMAWSLNQPIEFQAEISLNNQFLGDAFHSIAPEKFNLTNSSFEGRNTIILKGKAPFFSMFTLK